MSMSLEGGGRGEDSGKEERAMGRGGGSAQGGEDETSDGGGAAGRRARGEGGGGEEVDLSQMSLEGFVGLLSSCGVVPHQISEVRVCVGLLSSCVCWPFERVWCCPALD
jgi:hypothetical protein